MSLLLAMAVSEVPWVANERKGRSVRARRSHGSVGAAVGQFKYWLRKFLLGASCIQTDGVPYCQCERAQPRRDTGGRSIGASARRHQIISTGRCLPVGQGDVPIAAIKCWPTDASCAIK